MHAIPIKIFKVPICPNHIPYRCAKPILLFPASRGLAGSFVPLAACSCVYLTSSCSCSCFLLLCLFPCFDLHVNFTEMLLSSLFSLRCCSLMFSCYCCCFTVAVLLLLFRSCSSLNSLPPSPFPFLSFFPLPLSSPLYMTYYCRCSLECLLYFILFIFLHLLIPLYSTLILHPVSSCLYPKHGDDLVTLHFCLYFWYSNYLCQRGVYQ
ncbi:GTP-binding protein ypt1 [Histoplasma capsulatum G186AR]|uniref:GTP-binding protein ypt1 n=1 Tax=Ajellomyces capsulatus TaxID=5037 RepID=A0A8H7YPB7_AJECA|nr:GTP-binding protein ypt1 [Histoplasma capsulatum]QSS74002.1 GTP-binding protein ypt1 [Histoplasma capsulatum G186AR]